MVNPFIDDQAFESDDEYDADIVSRSGRGEEEGQAVWYDEDNPNVHDEDRLTHLDNTAPLGSQPQARHEALTDRLMAQYVEKRADSHPANRIGTTEEIDNTVLKYALYQEEQQIFWHVKCKTGSEMDLVFDIMLHAEDLLGAMPVESSLSDTPPSTEPVQDGEPKVVADELEKILGTEWSIKWTRLIDAAGLEPGDDDIHAALSAVNLRATNFLPTSVLQEADSSSLHPSTSSSASNPVNIPPVRTSAILSAFSVPTVSGFVYLEGHCDDKWLHWLMQCSTVFKKSDSKIWIEPVECGDIGILLDTPISSIQSMSWVRVKYGLYHGDCRTETDCPPTPPPKPTHPLIGDTTPIPSKPLNEQSGGKHKRTSEHPPQKLFHPQTFPGKLIEISEEIYESNLDEFRYGLVVQYYDSHSLSQQDIRMDTITCCFFGLSRDPLLNQVRLPVPDDWSFFAEEEVTAIVGFPETDGQRVNLNLDLPQSTSLKNGVIVDAGVQTCTVQFWDYDNFASEDTKISISVLNLRK
ncbi:hypothetical protein VKT23_016606 [Stygiomarasmius scandens]|uniref:Uncharacterized protein n=1 Tax=Marasmiellus scandens TaxID=2682957 RepID=A0ABR1IXS7_9AGAR